jgi:hypothetical protein
LKTKEEAWRSPRQAVKKPSLFEKRGTHKTQAQAVLENDFKGKHSGYQIKDTEKVRPPLWVTWDFKAALRTESRCRDDS